MDVQTKSTKFFPITLLLIASMFVIAILIWRVQSESDQSLTLNYSLHSQPVGKDTKKVELVSSDEKSDNKSEILTNSDSGSEKKTYTLEEQIAAAIKASEEAREKALSEPRSEFRHNDRAVARDPNPILPKGSKEHDELYEKAKRMLDAGEGKPFGDDRLSVDFEWRDYSVTGYLWDDGRITVHATDYSFSMHYEETLAAKIENLNVDTFAGDWSSQREELVKVTFASVFGADKLQFDLLNCRQKYCLTLIRIDWDFNDTIDALDILDERFEELNADTFGTGYSSEAWLYEIWFY